MDEVNILTREASVPKNILPTGRQVGIGHVRGIGMYEIKYVDGKPGELPDEYKSKFTGIMSAEKTLKRLVNAFWDISDKASFKKK
jgi:hypothetical protein